MVDHVPLAYVAVPRRTLAAVHAVDVKAKDVAGLMAAHESPWTALESNSLMEFGNGTVVLDDDHLVWGALARAVTQIDDRRLTGRTRDASLVGSI